MRKSFVYLLLGIGILSFSDIYAAKSRGSCSKASAKLAKSTKAQSAGWAGEKFTRITQIIRGLQMMDVMSQTEIFVIVSDSGFEASDSAPRALLQTRAPANHVSARSLRQSKANKAALFELSGMPSRIGKLLADLPIQRDLNGGGIRWVGRKDPFEKTSRKSKPASTRGPRFARG